MSDDGFRRSIEPPLAALGDLPKDVGAITAHELGAEFHRLGRVHFAIADDGVDGVEIDLQALFWRRIHGATMLPIAGSCNRRHTLRAAAAAHCSNAV